MSRKILKVLISILFLAAAAVAAVFSIKSFFPELFEQVKYGVKHIIGEPARKTPAFKKDEQEQEPRIAIAPTNGRKYGVAPVDMPPINYGRSKYGVAPVRNYENKVIVEPEDIDADIPKYGVLPVEDNERSK